MSSAPNSEIAYYGHFGMLRSIRINSSGRLMRSCPRGRVAERVGFEHFGRSLRISMLPILQGTSFPRNPLESPQFPPDLSPQLFTQVRSNSGLGGIDVSQ